MDSARPLSVSIEMYKKMKGTPFEKYVANPAKGSMHNYAVAVDVTIVDINNNEINMGFTPFYKNPIQITNAYKNFIKNNLTDKQIENRNLLKKVMLKAGFFPLSYEWWHFNGIKKDIARKKYKIIK